MTDEPLDHERILRVTKVLKAFDLEDKKIALSVLANILTVHIELSSSKAFVVTQQDDSDEIGFTIASNAHGLQILIPRDALDPERATTIN